MEVRANVEWERYVLGSVIVSAGRAMDDLAPVVSAEDFYRPQHESLWRRFMSLHTKGEPLEAAAVAGTLLSDPIPGVGLDYLHTIAAECTTWTNAEFYARKLRRLSRLRRLQVAGVRLAQTAAEASEDDADQAYAAALAAVESAGSDVTEGTVSDFGSLFLDSFDRWESQETGVIPTGLTDLDNVLLGGLRPGHLTVIAARPAQGKSFVAASIARHTAEAGFCTFMESQEMSRFEFTDRIVADVSGVYLSKLTKRALTPGDWDKVSRAHARTQAWPLAIDDQPNMTVAAMKARAKDMARRLGHPLRVLIVDYIQLMQPADTRAPRQEQVASLSRSLKLLAKELQVPVVSLAQLNRLAEGRASKRPELSDLRESGAIEQDADEVILLHHETEGVMDMIVAKNRQGSTDTVKVSWMPQFGRVATLARQ